MCDSTPAISGITARASDDRAEPRSLLEVRVTDGASGPVVVLDGEADMTSLAQLRSALDAQVRAGARLLTVDLSRLRFADSASVAALVAVARTLRNQGGQLELVRPQPVVARILNLTGVDQVLVVRGEADPGPEPRIA